MAGFQDWVRDKLDAARNPAPKPSAGSGFAPPAGLAAPPAPGVTPQQAVLLATLVSAARDQKARDNLAAQTQFQQEAADQMARSSMPSQPIPSPYVGTTPQGATDLQRAILDRIALIANAAQMGPTAPVSPQLAPDDLSQFIAQRNAQFARPDLGPPVPTRSPYDEMVAQLPPPPANFTPPGGRTFGPPAPVPTVDDETAPAVVTQYLPAMARAWPDLSPEERQVAIETAQAAAGGAPANTLEGPLASAAPVVFGPLVAAANAAENVAQDPYGTLVNTQSSPANKDAPSPLPVQKDRQRFLEANLPPGQETFAGDEALNQALAGTRDPAALAQAAQTDITALNQGRRPPPQIVKLDDVTPEMLNYLNPHMQRFVLDYWEQKQQNPDIDTTDIAPETYIAAINRDLTDRWNMSKAQIAEANAAYERQNPSSLPGLALMAPGQLMEGMDAARRASTREAGENVFLISQGKADEQGLGGKILSWIGEETGLRTEFYDFARNPDNAPMIANAMQNGYTADNGAHFEGGEAVWELFINGQSRFHRTVYDLAYDPLTYLPIPGKVGEGVVRGAEAIGATSDLGRAAARGLRAGGTALQVPNLVLNKAADEAVSGTLRATREQLTGIPVVGKAFETSAETLANDARNRVVEASLLQGGLTEPSDVIPPASTFESPPPGSVPPAAAPGPRPPSPADEFTPVGEPPPTMPLAAQGAPPPSAAAVPEPPVSAAPPAEVPEPVITAEPRVRETPKKKGVTDVAGPGGEYRVERTASDKGIVREINPATDGVKRATARRFDTYDLALDDARTRAAGPQAEVFAGTALGEPLPKPSDILAPEQSATTAAPDFTGTTLGEPLPKPDQLPIIPGFTPDQVRDLVARPEVRDAIRTGAKDVTIRDVPSLTTLGVAEPSGSKQMRSMTREQRNKRLKARTEALRAGRSVEGMISAMTPWAGGDRLADRALQRSIVDPATAPTYTAFLDEITPAINTHNVRQDTLEAKYFPTKKVKISEEGAKTPTFYTAKGEDEKAARKVVGGIETTVDTIVPAYQKYYPDQPIDLLPESERTPPRAARPGEKVGPQHASFYNQVVDRETGKRIPDDVAFDATAHRIIPGENLPALMEKAVYEHNDQAMRAITTRFEHAPWLPEIRSRLQAARDRLDALAPERVPPPTVETPPATPAEPATPTRVEAAPSAAPPPTGTLPGMGETTRPTFPERAGLAVPPQTTAPPLDLRAQVLDTPEARRQAETLAGQTDLFAPPPSAATAPPVSGVPGEETVPTASITTRPDLFQPRKKLNEALIARRAENWSWNKYKRIDIWRDPATGQDVVLAGHHRLAAAQQAGIADLPVSRFEGTLQEAKDFARRSNSQAEGLTTSEIGYALRDEMDNAQKQGRPITVAQAAKEYGSLTHAEATRAINISHLTQNMQDLVDQDKTLVKKFAAMGEYVRDGISDPAEMEEIWLKQALPNNWSEAEIRAQLAVAKEMKPADIQQGGLFAGMDLGSTRATDAFEKMRQLRKDRATQQRIANQLNGVIASNDLSTATKTELRDKLSEATARVQAIERELGITPPTRQTTGAEVGTSKAKLSPRNNPARTEYWSSQWENRKGDLLPNAKKDDPTVREVWRNNLNEAEATITVRRLDGPIDPDDPVVRDTGQPVRAGRTYAVLESELDGYLGTFSNARAAKDWHDGMRAREFEQHPEYYPDTVSGMTVVPPGAEVGAGVNPVDMARDAARWFFLGDRAKGEAPPLVQPSPDAVPAATGVRQTSAVPADVQAVMQGTVTHPDYQGQTWSEVDRTFNQEAATDQARYRDLLAQGVVPDPPNRRRRPTSLIRREPIKPGDLAWGELPPVKTTVKLGAEGWEVADPAGTVIAGPFPGRGGKAEADAAAKKIGETPRKEVIRLPGKKEAKPKTTTVTRYTPEGVAAKIQQPAEISPGTEMRDLLDKYQHYGNLETADPRILAANRLGQVAAEEVNPEAGRRLGLAADLFVSAVYRVPRSLLLADPATSWGYTGRNIGSNEAMIAIGLKGQGISPLKGMSAKQMAHTGFDEGGGIAGESLSDTFGAPGRGLVETVAPHKGGSTSLDPIERGVRTPTRDVLAALKLPEVIARAYDWKRGLDAAIERGMKLAGAFHPLFTHFLAEQIDPLSARIGSLARSRGINLADDTLADALWNARKASGGMSRHDVYDTTYRLLDEASGGKFDEKIVRDIADRASRDWASQAKGALDEAKHQTNRIFPNRRMTNADKYLSYATLFHMWPTRAAAFFLEESIRDPRLPLWWYRAHEGLNRLAEEEDYPTAAQGWIKLAQSVLGFTLFTDPSALFLLAQLKPDHPEYPDPAGETGLGHALNWLGDKTGLTPVPMVDALLNMAGVYGNAFLPDPFPSRSRKLAGQALDALLTSTGHHPGSPVYQRMMSWLRDQVSSQTDAVGSTHVPYADPADQRHDPIAWMILSLNPDLAARIKDPATQADALVEWANLAGDPDSDLYREAERRIAQMGFWTQLVNGLTPFSLRTKNMVRERTKDASHAVTETDYGRMTPQERADKTAWKAGLTPPEAMQLGAEQGQYAAVGADTRGKAMAERWNEIAYGDNPRPHNIGGRVWLPGELLQLDTDSRIALADAWVAQVRGTPELETYRTDRDAYVAAHPAYGDYDKYQAAVRDYRGGPAAWRRDFARDNANFARAMADYEAYARETKGLDGGALAAEMDRWAASMPAYQAATGIKGYDYGADPITGGKDWRELAANDKVLAGGFGGTGSTKADPAAQLKKDILRYQTDVALFDLTLQQLYGDPNAHWANIQNPVQRRALQWQMEQRGYQVPTMPASVERYQRWASMQPRGAPSDIGAYMAWRAQFDATIKAAGYDPNTVYDWALANAGIYAGTTLGQPIPTTTTTPEASPGR